MSTKEINKILTYYLIHFVSLLFTIINVIIIVSSILN